MLETLRILVGLGLTLLLVMLRLEAARFGAAEYDEPVGSHQPSVLRRLAWYILGVGGVLALLLAHPAAEQHLFLQIGDKWGVLLALVLGGVGIAQAVAVAWYHYRRLRFPNVMSYPGALANEILTAFIDEAVFRGALLGYFLWAGAPDTLAIVGQAVVYVLATRLGAPGRDKYMLLLAGVIGVVGGWATLATGGIGAAFIGHAITRVAVFLTTGHAGQPPARGTDIEDEERRRRTPDGWSAVDRSSARDR
jgi:CAAX amino terminal protease family.